MDLHSAFPVRVYACFMASSWMARTALLLAARSVPSVVFFVESSTVSHIALHYFYIPRGVS